VVISAARAFLKNDSLTQGVTDVPNPIGLSDEVKFSLRFTLRILVVTDGAINLWDTPPEPEGNNQGFTLREMARALWDAPKGLYPYTNFVVDHAIHGTGGTTTRARTVNDPETGKTRTWMEYESFRFDSPGFRLDSYQQVWFFGFWPGNPAPNGQYSTPSHRAPLSTSELRILTTWMNAGGGVFATGDHGLLGTHLCGHIPRVNKMRRWFELGLSNSVPSPTDSGRVDTIVPVRTTNGRPEVVFEDQSDDTPKPLNLKRYTLWDGALRLAQSPSRYRLNLSSRWAPHPILCSPLGAINILPDHMHEGLVCEDDEVVLTSADSNGIKEFPGGARRPTPEVIAWATIRGGNVVYNDFGYPTLSRRVVPTISVYDGQRANVGRVVVDSTWHNWLDINVRGTGAAMRINPQTGQPEKPTGLQGKNLELVHNYVRNIAQWLATEVERDWMRYGLHLHIIANTGGWAELVNVRRLIGERAANVLGQVVSECTLNQMVFEKWWGGERLAGVGEDGAAKLVLPSREFVYQHVLGAMTEAAFELIPRLPRHDGSDERLPECDSVKEFELITARLDSARRDGVRAMTAEWRDALKYTSHFLDTVEQSAGADGCPTHTAQAGNPYEPLTTVSPAPAL
jgi:hypothetical protein